MTSTLKKAVALTAAAATPFAIAAFAAWSFGPAADGDYDVPAAVVNLDELLTTTAEDGTETTMFAGRQVVTDLVADEDDGFEFLILNDEDAAAALADGEVQAVVTIPPDFSQRVLSLQGDEPRQAGIRIVTDATSSGLATSLASETGESIMASFGDVVTNGFISGLYGGLGTLAEELGTAADGADAVGDGGAELADGLGELAGGIDQLADGAGSAQDGAGELAAGGDQLAAGLGSAQSGISQLAGGASGLSDGVGQYTRGVDQLAGGAASLSDGVDQYTGGIDQLAGGAASLSDGVGQYTGGVDQFAGGVQQATAQISDGLDQAFAAGGIDELEAAIESSSSAAAQVVAALEADPDTDPQVLEAARQLAGGLGQLSQQDIAGQLTSGLGEVTAGLDQLDAGAAQLVAGGAELRGGASQLADGAAQASAGSPALRDGASQLADGAAQASAGSPALRDGASQLSGGLAELDGGFGASVTGAQQLASGTRELGNGLGELESGAVQLAAGARSAQTGASQLGDGATELGDGLRTAVAALPQLSDSELADLSEVATNPVGFNLSEQNAVPSGEARIATVAVPIGLWLGALALALVLARSRRRVFGSAEPNGRVLTTLLVRSAWVVAVQALLATVVVHAIGGVAWTAAPATFGVALLFAAVATLLHLAFIAWWGPVGAVVSIVLLGLQAVAAGGIVPRAVLGSGFDAIAPALPMTHAVDALQAIATGAGGAWGAVAMLVIFAGAGLLAAYLAVRSARRRETGARIRSLDALAPTPGLAAA
ncbi:hypothetical protein [Agrococcus sp. Ld7]|uniref:hypothetical protein n=1 Tax=Agrococcus sp. Ld7 TaxID=649148 RepID=UPI003865055C